MRTGGDHRPDRRAGSPLPGLEHVAGYCIANDYAIRDYLENWYRPNLRVKNRDGATVLGPWFVDAADVADPGSLGLRTFVNDKLTQSGNTRDLIFDIPYLVEYLSSFMTLSPGDVILTGTPEGVVNVMPGDVVACEIDGLGRLSTPSRQMTNSAVEGQSMQIQHLINGAAVPGSEYFETINPATQEVLAEVARGGDKESTSPLRPPRLRFPRGPASPPPNARHCCASSAI